jgi:polysaccharide deacetylase family protein (PEP-CTERM system associated)
MSAGTAPMRHAMTIDVEDYFQVQAFAGQVARADWDDFALRVAESTGRILDAFARAGVQGTFFTLGWVAERCPATIRAIVAGGHELASHGYDHTRADAQDPGTFRADVRRTKRILEDLGGVEVRGYRAATFSIGPRNPWAFSVLEEEGYRYSSSTYPVRHDLYGNPAGARAPFRPSGTRICEVPMTTLRLAGHNLPCSGGGYFRLLPYPVYRRLFAAATRANARPGIFYLHPWEVDPDQPRIPGAGLRTRLRHNVNLRRTATRLDALLADFAWDRMDRVFANDIAAAQPGPASSGHTPLPEARAA